MPEKNSSHESHEIENASNLFEEPIKSEESATPVQRLKEVEARGRNLRLREAMIPSSTQAAVSPTSIRPIGRIVIPSKSNLDQVKEWALQNKHTQTLNHQIIRRQF
ncbi:MAG TPA: hypothetical protein VJK54_09490 [Chthoniobacterales bacterium]|nr:hypothetical protein [Chthoniobacterales bacterium]